MKRIKWRFTFLLTGSLYLCTMLSMAQSIDPPVHQFMFQTETQVPNVALLNRFGDYSVDLANGLVDISIPLHTVRGRQLSLPITMRFHASGLRASDYEGPIGLGWALDAGGHISRTMRGYPDEMLPFVQDLGPNTEPEFKTLFGRTLKGDINGQNSGYNLEFYVDPYSPSTRGEYRDTEYDIFTYCLPNGKSGKFILEDVNGVKIPFTIPYEPVKIDMRKSSSGSGYGTFWITDEDGTKYRFGKYTDTDTRQAIDFNLGENFQQYASTWYLTSITSADGQDVIQLNYERDGVAARAGRESNTVEITDNYRTLTSHTLEPVGTLSMYDILEEQLILGPVVRKSESWSGVTQYYKPLASISFEGGIVEFSYAQSGGDPRSLASIVVKDNHQTSAIPLKNISFTLTPRSGDNPRLLQTLTIKAGSSTSQEVEKYQFTYHDEADLPTYSDLRRGKDLWGFYLHGASDDLVEDQVHVKRLIDWDPITVNIGYPFHATNESDMKIGMIKSIKYPTGGRTEFDYEANSFVLNGSSVTGPGLRIKSVINYPDPNSSAKTETRTFTYVDARIQHHLIPPGILFSGYYGQRNFFTEREMMVYLRQPSNSTLAHDHGIYTIRIIHNEYPKEYFDLISSMISYGEVTEYLGTPYVNSGKTVSKYETSGLETQYWTSGPQYIHQLPDLRIDPRNYWLAFPRIASKEQYMRNGTAYELVHKTDYSYTYLTKDDLVYDLPVFRFRDHYMVDLDYRNRLDWDIIELVYDGMGLNLDYKENFAYHNQCYNTGAVKLAQVTETSYSGGLPTVSSTESYEYNDQYLLSDKSKSNSDGTVWNTTYRYPFEITGGIYPQMTGLNMLSMPIEITERSNDKVTGGTLMAYKNFGNGKYYPEYLYALKKLEGLSFTAYNGSVGNNYHTPAESQVTQRDSKGNIQEVLEKGVYTTYLWGYNSRYPVAEIKNARYSQIPYSITSVLASTAPDTTALNNLRTSLPNAQVTTYTYKPLVGIETITDPSGRKTYYEYDNYGRLIYIKDENGHILEKYEYNYKNN